MAPRIFEIPHEVFSAHSTARRTSLPGTHDGRHGVQPVVRGERGVQDDGPESERRRHGGGRVFSGTRGGQLVNASLSLMLDALDARSPTSSIVDKQVVDETTRALATAPRARARRDGRARWTRGARPLDARPGRRDHDRGCVRVAQVGVRHAEANVLRKDARRRDARRDRRRGGGLEAICTASDSSCFSNE